MLLFSARISPFLHLFKQQSCVQTVISAFSISAKLNTNNYNHYAKAIKKN